jgi:hypothetical protein
LNRSVGLAAPSLRSLMNAPHSAARAPASCSTRTRRGSSAPICAGPIVLFATTLSGPSAHARRFIRPWPPKPGHHRVIAPHNGCTSKGPSRLWTSRRRCSEVRGAPETVGRQVHGCCPGYRGRPCGTRSGRDRGGLRRAASNAGVTLSLCLRSGCMLSGARRACSWSAAPSVPGCGHGPGDRGPAPGLEPRR